MRKKNLAGVTLVELLIVISILVILGTVGMMSYREAKKNIETELTIDSFITELEGYREESKKGNVCVGMGFSGGGYPKTLKTPYRNPKDGCKPPIRTSFGYASIGSTFGVSSLKLDQNELPEIVLLFSPPRGDMIFFPDGETLEITMYKHEKKVIISKNASTITKK